MWKKSPILGLFKGDHSSGTNNWNIKKETSVHCFMFSLNLPTGRVNIIHSSENKYTKTEVNRSMSVAIFR